MPTQLNVTEPGQNQVGPHRYLAEEELLAYGRSPEEGQAVSARLNAEMLERWQLQQAKAAGEVRLGAGVLFKNSDGSYMLEQNHADKGMPKDRVGKLRPAGGGFMSRDKNLRGTIIRELKEEFGLEREFVEPRLTLLGFIKDGDFKDCAMFEMKDHGLTPKRYQASNSKSEYVVLKKAELNDTRYIGKKPDELRAPKTKLERACANLPADDEALEDFREAVSEAVEAGKLVKDMTFYCGSDNCLVNCGDWHERDEQAAAVALAKKFFRHVTSDSEVGQPAGTRKIYSGHAKEAAAAPVFTETPTSGPTGIMAFLQGLDLDELEKHARAEIATGKATRRGPAVKTLQVIEGLRRNNLQPSDLMIRQVPVLPPNFRPFSVAGETFIVGDSNELYRDLMEYKRLHQETKTTLGDAASGDSRLALYDSAKALYGYGDPVSAKLKQRGVSGFLSKILGTGPKFSFVQRKLLSKPQDNVSRGVIIPDPDLGLDEVGVPKDMAWKTFAPYVQRRLVRSGMSPGSALEAIEARSREAERALNDEVKERPVIYSRAPAWHKHSVLAGYARLVDGDAIKINNLVTTGQNADFDGDTINIHVPALPESVTEARERLLPSKMLFTIRSPNKTMPNPKHEQVLGAFTAQLRPAKRSWQFSDPKQAEQAIDRGEVDLSDEIEITP